MDEYHFISKIHPPAQVQSKLQTKEIEKKFLRILFEILASKDANSGMIDYYNMIKIIGDYGIKFNQLKKVKNDGEKLPLSSQMFTNIVNEHIKRNERIGNGRGISDDTKDLIKKFYLSSDISRVSPNKTRVVKRKSKNNVQSIVESIYYRQFPIADIYQKFLEKYPQIKISRSSFFALKPKCCKRPKSKQDVCPTCKESKKNRKRLEEIHPSNLTNEERKALDGYKFHEKIALTRNSDFKNELKRLKQGQCLIIMDFKANISLGGCAEEDSHQFFFAPQRTVFGLALYFVKDGKTFKINFSIVSPILMHDSFSVKRILDEIVLPHPIFNHFGCNELSFWMDNGPSHFRTYETMATFDFLSKKFNKKIKFNFFCEYHGKNECDRHFGLMSRLYADYSATNELPISTTDDYIKMYKEKILSYGGVVINKNGFVYDELKSKEEKKLNVIIEIWTYDKVENFLKQVGTHINIDKINDPKKRTPKNIISAPYDQQVCTFASSTKFKYTYYYQFHMDAKNQKVLAKLYNKKVGKQYYYDIETTDEKDGYSMKIGSVLDTQKLAGNSIERLNRKKKYHSEYYK